MDKFIAAIDTGTTSGRVIIYNQKGEIQGSGQQPIQCYYPNNAWVEQQPEEIWATTLRTWRQALSDVGITAQAITGIGITNQRETTIVWDRQTGEPIYNATVWQDRRTSEICAKFHADGVAPMIQQKTGLLLDAYFSATKLAWILENVPGARKRAENGELCFGTVECFILSRLSLGQSHIMDMTNAARTMLFNIHTLEWDDELLKLFNIPRSLLPEVKPNIAEFGVTDAKHWGAAVPVLAMAGDQHAAMIGQACVDKGMAKMTYGTGGFLMVNEGHHLSTASDSLLQTIGYCVEDKPVYAIEGSIFAAGVTVQWLRDTMHLISDARQTEKMARKVDENGGVYLIPAFTGLGAPHWRSDARAAIMGITRDTHPEHIIRAGLEAVCYQTKDLLDVLHYDITELRLDGGMVKNTWLCQFLADVLDREVEQAKNNEATASGVMHLVRLKLGLLGSLDELKNEWQSKQIFEPSENQSIVQGYHKEWLIYLDKILS